MFVTYALVVVLLLIILIVWVAPARGTSNIMVYVAICSLLGSFTVPSSKGLGLAVPDAFGEGPSSGRARALFLGLLGTLAVSILTQFFFINKALECFSSNIFEAIYYVTFTSTVILASGLLFKEWTALTITDSLAILCALTTVCVGVVLLHISQEALITWKKKEEKSDWFRCLLILYIASVPNLSSWDFFSTSSLNDQNNIRYTISLFYLKYVWSNTRYDVNSFISLTLNQPNYLMTPFILKKISFLMFLCVFLMPLSMTEWTLTTLNQHLVWGYGLQACNV